MCSANSTASYRRFAIGKAPEKFERTGTCGRGAECNSAIQQITNYYKSALHLNTYRATRLSYVLFRIGTVTESIRERGAASANGLGKRLFSGDEAVPALR
jgi:hypothetical protein